MSIPYQGQMQEAGNFTVAATPAAVTVTLGWQPAYVKAININDVAEFEYFEGMADDSAVKHVTAGDMTIETSDMITVATTGFTIGTGIGDTASDVVRWIAFR